MTPRPGIWSRDATTGCCDLSQGALANVSLTMNSTLREFSQVLHYDELSVKNSLIEMTLLTILFGLFTVLAAVAAYILLSKDARLKTTLIMLMSVFVMWVSTVTYWVMTLVAAESAYSALTNATSWGISRMTDVQSCLDAISGSDATLSICQLELAFAGTQHGSSKVSMVQECTGNVALTVNIIVGDSIVWWRALVLWPDSRVVRLVCVLMLLLTALTGAIDTRDACVPHYVATGTTTPCIAGIWQSSHSGDVGNPGNVFSGDVWGTVAEVLSLLSNVVATTLIAYRAWEHRCMIMSYLRASARGRTKVERVLALLVESGLLYCALWVVMVVLEFWDWFPGAPGYQGGFYYVMSCCLVPLIGMYPTLVIIVCAASKSIDERVSGGPLPVGSFALNTPRGGGLGSISGLVNASSADSARSEAAAGSHMGDFKDDRNPVEGDSVLHHVAEP